SLKQRTWSCNMWPGRVAPPPLDFSLYDRIDLARIANECVPRGQTCDQVVLVVGQLIGFIDYLQIEHLVIGIKPGPLRSVANDHTRPRRHVTEARNNRKVRKCGDRRRDVQLLT